MVWLPNVVEFGVSTFIHPPPSMVLLLFRLLGLLAGGAPRNGNGHRPGEKIAVEGIVKVEDGRAWSCSCDIRGQSWRCFPMFFVLVVFSVFFCVPVCVDWNRSCVSLSWGPVISRGIVCRCTRYRFFLHRIPCLT